MNIYVGNLSYNTTNEDLNETFSPFGQVASAQVIIDRDTGRSRGFGFVEMADETNARDAISGLNGKDLGWPCPNGERGEAPRVSRQPSSQRPLVGHC